MKGREGGGLPGSMLVACMWGGGEGGGGHHRDPCWLHVGCVWGGGGLEVCTASGALTMLSSGRPFRCEPTTITDPDPVGTMGAGPPLTPPVTELSVPYALLHT